jgi:hypothetical protein
MRFLLPQVVPNHRDMDFPELVEALVDRYLPQLKERVAAAAAAEAAGADGGEGA